jgi:hypothetical protein
MRHNSAWRFLPILSSVIGLLVVILFCSCEEKNVYKAPEIAGYYEMKSLRSDLAVDLDNDGVVSTDAMAEISRVTFIRQYNFSAPYAFLQIRPTKEQDVRTQHLYVPFPHPHVTFENTDSPNGRVGYTNNDLAAFGYGYAYGEKNKTVQLDRANVRDEDEEVWGKLVGIQVLDRDKLQLTVSKDYYDFKQARWVRLQLIGVYTKVSP